MSKPINNKSGVTLVEVIFAIGVVLIGLVGLISVLPIAGRRAQDAISLNEGNAVAVEAFQRLESYDLLRRDSWVVVDDTAASYGVLSAANILFDNVDGYCIDPLFVSDSFGRMAESVSTGGYYQQYVAGSASNGHRRRLFPYYKQEYSPYTDPSENVTAASAWSLWPMFGEAPRMVRVGLLGGGSLISAAEATLIGEDFEGIAYSKTDDKTLNVSPQATGAVDAGIDYGKKVTDGRYSWFATVNRLPGTRYASLAVVVVRDRNRLFETRKNVDGVASRPDQNANSERLAYVTSATGFRGGAGGTIEMVMTDTVSKELTSDNWVMLSRRDTSGTTPFSIHRWYRVVGVLVKPEKVSLSDPVTTSTSDVLRYKVILDGPDWSFGFATPGNADTGAGVADNTFVTLVDGVVTVHEHVLRLGNSF